MPDSTFYVSAFIVQQLRFETNLCQLVKLWLDCKVSYQNLLISRVTIAYNTLVSQLPPKLNNGLRFFEECLKEKTIVVPGIFFDINPSQRRDLFDSTCHHFVRLSYGPRMDLLEKGLNGMERVLKKSVPLAIP